MRYAFALFGLLLMLALPATAQQPTGAPEPAAQANRAVELVIFWEQGCPYCEEAKRFFNARPETQDWLNLRLVEVSSSDEALANFLRASRLLGVSRPGVPLMFVGGRHFIGYDRDDTTGAEILAIAESCRARDCPSLETHLKTQAMRGGAPASAPARDIRVPFFGAVSLAGFSLPALTVFLAAVDGFNPCAMWVLVFLIGLLAGMQDRARMWLLGGAFLLTSGAVYFLFLAAWLNLFLLIGALAIVRIGVGAVALASGGWYLWSFTTNAAAECQVTNPEQRRRIMDGLRASVYEKRFFVALGGIVILAAATNLIELLCSAGIPAVFTDILALSDLPAWGYYAYLLLYVFVFMIDDMAIFAIAMWSLSVTGLTSRYLRLSHLLGGVAMVAIGALLIFAPGWLAFSG